MFALLILAACADSDPGKPDTATTTITATTDDTGSDCLPLTFDPNAVTVAPTRTAEVRALGCATSFAVSCPEWAAMAVPDPIETGDVGTISSRPGFSGTRAGECVLTWADGEARISVELTP